MAKKFIVFKDEDFGYEVALGHVQYHIELVPSSKKREDVVGGGLWHHDSGTKTMFFWGVSTEFGQATKEQFDTAMKNGYIGIRLEDMNVIFSDLLDFEDVLKEHGYGEHKINQSKEG